MHGGALAQKASKQKELSDHKLVKASNKRHGGGYSACALDPPRQAEGLPLGVWFHYCSNPLQGCPG